MAYDFYGSWDSSGSIDVMAPLTTVSGESDPTNSDFGSVQYLIQNGVPPSKINLGMGLYGRTFKVKGTNTTPGAAQYSGTPWAGPCTQESGTLSYPEIAFVKKDTGAIFTQDGSAYYATYTEGGALQWVGYDDRASLILKMQLAAANGLHGVFVWSLDQDLVGTGSDSFTTFQPDLLGFISNAASSSCTAHGLLPIGTNLMVLYTTCPTNSNEYQPNQCLNGQWVPQTCISTLPASGWLASRSLSVTPAGLANAALKAYPPQASVRKPFRIRTYVGGP